MKYFFLCKITAERKMKNPKQISDSFPPALGVFAYIGAMPTSAGSRVRSFFSPRKGLERLRTAVYRFCRPVHYHFATAPILGILLFNPLPVYATQITGTASWYSSECCKYNPDPKCPTASGESLYALEEKKEKFAAMWKVPFGSSVRVCNQRNGKCTYAVINDRGPNKRLGRVIDLSKKAFEEIANLKEGLINVTVEVL